MYAMDPYGDECDTILKDIIKKRDTYTLYIDLSESRRGASSDDVEVLRKYAYDKFYTYTTERGKYIIDDDEYRELF